MLGYKNDSMMNEQEAPQASNPLFAAQTLILKVSDNFAGLRSCLPETGWLRDIPDGSRSMVLILKSGGVFVNHRFRTDRDRQSAYNRLYS